MRRRRQPDYTMTETVETVPKFTAAEPTEIKLEAEPQERMPKVDYKTVKVPTKTVTFNLAPRPAANYNTQAVGARPYSVGAKEYQKNMAEYKVELDTQPLVKELTQAEQYYAYDHIPIESRAIQLKKQLNVGYGSVAKKPTEPVWNEEALNAPLSRFMDGDQMQATELQQFTKGHLLIGGSNPNKVSINTRGVLSESGLFGSRLTDELY